MAIDEQSGGLNTSENIIGPAALSALDTDLLTGVVNGWLDVRGFVTASITILAGAGIASGAIQFEGTNDPTLDAPGRIITTATEVGVSLSGGFVAITIAASTSRTWIVPISMSYIRVRISPAFVGGTVRAVANLRTTTLQTVTTSNQGVSGTAAHDAPIAGNPFRVAGRAQSASYATVQTGDVADLITTLQGVLITKPYQIPELDWSYVAAAGGILNTTAAVTIKAAAAAGLRNYITCFTVMSEAVGAATEIAIRDGAAGPVLWRTKVPLAGLPTVPIDLPTPIRGSAATLLEVVTLTASITGAVYFNVQGYVAP